MREWIKRRGSKRRSEWRDVKRLRNLFLSLSRSSHRQTRRIEKRCVESKRKAYTFIRRCELESLSLSLSPLLFGVEPPIESSPLQRKESSGLDVEQVIGSVAKSCPIITSRMKDEGKRKEWGKNLSLLNSPLTDDAIG